MINIQKIKKNKFVIKYSGDNFDELNEICREYKIPYNSIDKCRYANRKECWKFLTESSKIENIPNFQEVYSLCYPDDMYKPVLRSLKKDLFVYPPIKGKSPNEKFQVQSIKKGICTNRFANFDEQGLGKTYQTITILNHINYYESLKKLVIICPTNVIYNWRKELSKFSTFFKDYSKCLIVNKDNKNFIDEDLTNYQVIIMNYNTFRLSYEDYFKKKYDRKLNYTKEGIKKEKNRKDKIRYPLIDFSKFGIKEEMGIILDESHRIKNMDALQSKMVLVHRELFEYRYVLTGTPAPNNETEIYNQIRFLTEDLLPDNYLKFIRFLGCKPNRFSTYAVDKDDIKIEKVEEMYNKISNICVRRKSEDCLDLPPLKVVENYCVFKPKHSKIYKYILKQRLETIKHNQGYISGEEVRNSCLFKQVNTLDSPQSVLNDESLDDISFIKYVKNFKITDHSKFDILDDLINKYVKEEKRKLIVWSYHPAVIELLCNYYKKLNPYKLHGGCFKASDDKAKVIHEINNDFEKDKNSLLFFASPKILKEGINMTYINRMIYFDRSMDLIEYLQSRKRIHRIGTKEEVIQHNLIVENSIDENIDAMLKDKEFLNKSLLNKDYFDIEDIEELFGI
jgi:SNF2 family DNA or RNA helicase